MDYETVYVPEVHPLEPSSHIPSPGGTFAYEIIGAVCRLYDREELPWPSCSLQWKGKQPSWNRIGKRFVPDVAATRSPSYAVRGVSLDGVTWEAVITLSNVRLTPEQKEWWVTPSCKLKHYI